MTDLNHGQGREPPQSPWRRLANLINPWWWETLHHRSDPRSIRPRWMECFAWRAHLTAIVAALGAAFGFAAGWACRLGPVELIELTLLATVAGMLVGFGLSPNWAAKPPVRLASPSGGTGRLGLWDPWLDEHAKEAKSTNVSHRHTGSDDELELEADVVECGEEAGGQVRIRPRVISSESGESMRLEDEIGPILVQHDRGAIAVSGPPGAGKSTALLDLARRLPPHFQVTFLDQPHPVALASAAEQGLVVCALSGQGRPNLLAEFTLAPWSRDDWIEYLLAADRGSCASVMARLSGQAAGDESLLEGIPELWQVVLDRMAADESVASPRQALWIELSRRLNGRKLRERVEIDCLTALIGRSDQRPRAIKRLRRHCTEPLFRLARHRAIQLLLAADRLANDLTEGAGCEALATTLPRDLVREAAVRIADRPEAVAGLQRLILAHDESRHPMAASLLHALGVDWKPDHPSPCLKGAYLEDAAWNGLMLTGADLRSASLHRAHLRGACLDRALLDDAQLPSADLRAASLLAACLDRTDLTHARLAGVQAQGSHFESACLRGADLEASSLDRTRLQRADLRGAKLTAAGLSGANLSHATLDGADFTGANLSNAVMPGVILSVARFENALFIGANLSRSNLEGMELSGAEFAAADLSHALLTSSCMPDGDFRNARLGSAGLAEIEWERADLRNADLRDASFHLGSSRSGLTGSTTPSEGSRTGFYTDDYDEQGFKSIEEIRKANLRGADLRGARIDGVDFYLVDLREAQIDPDQVLHLRRCGAILESRD